MPDTAQLIAAIEKGAYDTAFCALYGEKRVMQQRARYSGALRCFERRYGVKRHAALYTAAGRTEIGGNHTDHNNGLVMAAAVDLDIIAVAAKNEDGVCRVRSSGFEREDMVALGSLAPNPEERGQSQAMIRGIAAGIVQRGGVVGGFDAYTTSDVLKGSGLSSSAAFEVCMGAILNHEYNGGRFTPVVLSMVGQYAENAYFGKPCGLMDQLACAVGGALAIDFEQPDAPVVQQISVNLEQHGCQLVITDTGGSHADLTDEYALIRAEMESVAVALGKKVLRQAGPAAFYEALPSLRTECGDRAVLRAFHFFAECERVQKLAAALGNGSFEDFLNGINEGGRSSFQYNQNAYSARTPCRQPVPVALALSERVLGGRGAVRLQGGGFGGTIQAFVPVALVQEYKAELERVFGPGACHVLNIRRVGCAPVLPLV